MAGEEIERIASLCQAQRQRLRVVETQIAQFGEKWAPAHLLVERAETREAIARYETVLGSSLPAEVGDDLGDSGRFILYLEELRAVRQSIALYGRQLGDFIEETTGYRERHAIEHSRDRRVFYAAIGILVIIAAFILGKLI